MFSRKHRRAEPDEGTVYFALLYAVSLRGRRREDGTRAFTWGEIQRAVSWPGHVDSLIVAVVRHMDELERIAILRSERQKAERTTEAVQNVHSG